MESWVKGTVVKPVLKYVTRLVLGQIQQSFPRPGRKLESIVGNVYEDEHLGVGTLEPKG